MKSALCILVLHESLCVWTAFPVAPHNPGFLPASLMSKQSESAEAFSGGVVKLRKYTTVKVSAVSA